METRVCRTCGKTLPLDGEHFFKNGKTRQGKQRFMFYCIPCWEMRYKQEKAKARAQIVQIEDPMDSYRPKVCSGKCRSMDEFGICIHVQCRYHLMEISHHALNNEASVDDIVDRLLDMEYTCLWEVMEKLNPPLTQEEIGAIVGVTKQRIEQIETDGLETMKRKAPWLADLLIPEVSNRYVKPAPVLGVGRISEKTITPVWHQNNVLNPKNFVSGAPVHER